MDKLKAKLRDAQVKLSTYDDRPAATEAQKQAKAALEQEVIDTEKSIVELFMNSEPSALGTPVDSCASTMYLESNLLCQHLTSIGKFTGSSSEDAQVFINKTRAIVQSCRSLDFERIYAALKPKMSVNVLKTLEMANIKTLEDFVKIVTLNYGSGINCFQRIEAWQNKPKPFSKSFTQFHSEIVVSLDPIISSYEEMLKANRRKVAPNEDYTPSFRDAFSLFTTLKTLHAIRQESADLYSSIVVELSTFSTSDQLASRAQALAVQTAFTSVNAADSAAVGLSTKRKGNNSNAKQSDKSGNDDCLSTTSSNGQNPNKGKNQRKRGNNRGNDKGAGNDRSDNGAGHGRSDNGSGNRGSNNGAGNRGSNGNQRNYGNGQQNGQTGYPGQFRGPLPPRASHPYGQQQYGANVAESAGFMPSQTFEYYDSPGAAGYQHDNMYQYGNASYFVDPNAGYASKNL